MAPRPGSVNRRALHRHARCALEDFEYLRSAIVKDRWWMYEIENKMHSISHHLRHTVYRSGIETNWRTRVRRSGE